MPDFCSSHGRKPTQYSRLPDGSFGCVDCYNVKKMLGKKEK